MKPLFVLFVILFLSLTAKNIDTGILKFSLRDLAEKIEMDAVLHQEGEARRIKRVVPFKPAERPKRPVTQKYENEDQ